MRGEDPTNRFFEFFEHPAFDRFRGNCFRLGQKIAQRTALINASAAMTPSELETRSSLFRLPFESEELMICEQSQKAVRRRRTTALSISYDFCLILTVLRIEVKPKTHPCEQIPA